MIGNALNSIGLNTLMWAPIFMLTFGYWQLGNRQIFFNQIPQITHKNEIYDPKHDLIDFSDGYNYTLLYLIFIVVLLMFNLYSRILQKIGQLIGVFKLVFVGGE